MKTLLYILLIVLSFQSAIAQSVNNQEKLSLDRGSIDQQFEFLNKKASSYQNYRLIKKSWFNKIRANVKDSLDKKNSLIKAANDKIEEQKGDYAALQTKLDETNNKLKVSNETKDGIQFMGMTLKKTSFKTVFWTLISILSMILFFFIYSFNNSNKVTKNTLAQYKELEDEFNASRTRALEREQVLNRKLQDEINKHK